MELKTTRVPDCPPDMVSPGWKVELLDGGKSVSRLWVVDRMVRIGGSTFKVGGISSVGTEESHRGRGLAARVFEETLKIMEREGYDATILHGIPDFYHRFGYAPCMPEYNVRIATVNAERAPGPLRLRTLQDGDFAAIARLYNGENAWRTGTVVRDADTWKGFPRSVGFFTKPAVRVALDDKDRIKGYVVYDDEPTRCRAAESGGLGGDVLGSILRFLAQRAVDLRKEEVHLAVPPDHPLALYARKFGCEADIRYPRNGEFMGRIMRFMPFMEKVAAGLGRESDLPLPDGEVALSTELGACILACKGGQGSLGEPITQGTEGSARLGQSALFQMAMGYRSARDLHAAGELQATSVQIESLGAWFPLRNGCMYWADRF
jgi:predicted acetyltransferase